MSASSAARVAETCPVSTASSTVSSAGSSCSARLTTAGSSRLTTLGEATIRAVPSRDSSCSRTRASSASAWPSSRALSAAITSPASVSATERRLRSNSSTPTVRSNRATSWLTVGCEMCSRSAARPKCSVLATVRKTSS